MRKTVQPIKPSDLLGGRRDKEMILYLGGVHASAEPLLIRTLLGSCISVCLHDPVARVGGMNHFMLPTGTCRTEDQARFGVHAMELLIGAVQKAGGDRRRAVAKVFGGAHVLNIAESPGSVPAQNIEFIRQFLASEGYTLAAEDLGGHQPRVVYFHTETGQAFVRTIASEQAWRRVLAREARGQSQTPEYGGVTLFDQG